MVEFSDITVTKNGIRLFDHFNFTIHSGEHWVIQGGNGAGKTLLLQLIAGIIHPTTGEMKYSFIDAGDWDSRFRQRSEKIHFIQTHSLQSFPGVLDGAFYQQRYYSVEENNLPTVKDLLDDAAESLRRTGLSDNFDLQALLDVPVTRLSNGQLKKLVIIRQLSRHIPRLLLLDYPFDGLDAESRLDLTRFLDLLASRLGIQILMVDHSADLPEVINRRLVLDRFRVASTEAVRPVPRSTVLSMTGTKIHSSPCTGQPVVEMHNVTIRYGSRRILSDINWKICRGERWALTGRNGSGKTTLFSMIYADHPMAYSQEVFLFGKRRGSGESIWDIKNRISYFGPEQAHFLNVRTHRATAREYVLSHRHQNAKRIDELADFLDAGRYLQRPLYALSSGELQMVLLINVLADRREILLLDEPFQFLDPVNHDRITRFLQHHLDNDVTLVLITHDERDVSQWTKLRMHLYRPEEKGLR